MAELWFKEFRCVEETDEAGWDSVYFLVFHGRPDAVEDAGLFSVRDQGAFDSVGTGDLLSVNRRVCPIAENSVVVAVAVEEDGYPDLHKSAEFAAIRENFQLNFEHKVKEGVTSTKALGNYMSWIAHHVFDNFADNDDLIAARRVRLTTMSGPLPLVHLHGDGGYYKLRFEAK